MKPTIQYSDFEKLDLRVGKVTSAVAPQWSPNLLEYEVYFGIEIGTKKVLYGIQKWFKPEEIIGKSFVFIINLPERQMGKSMSQAMMLMAVPDDGKPTLLGINNGVISGTIVR